jgi:hypothetical protein
MTINSSSVRQDAWKAVYDVLSSSYLLSSTVTVTAAYIDAANAFPQVVINPVDLEKGNFTFSRAFYTRDITLDIDIWTKENKHKDLISDEIDRVLSSTTTLTGLMLVGWTESNALEPVGGNKIHLKTLRLNYMVV